MRIGGDINNVNKPEVFRLKIFFKEEKR